MTPQHKQHIYRVLLSPLKDLGFRVVRNRATRSVDDIVHIVEVQLSSFGETAYVILRINSSTLPLIKNMSHIEARLNHLPELRNRIDEQWLVVSDTALGHQRLEEAKQQILSIGVPLLNRVTSLADMVRFVRSTESEHHGIEANLYYHVHGKPI